MTKSAVCLCKVGLLAGLLVSADAAAAQAPAPPAGLKELSVCRSIAREEERLACYDKAAAALAQAVDRKELVVLDKQEMQRTRRSLFGFTLPRIGLFRSGEEEKELTSTIAGVKSVGNGLWEIRLEDGAVWRTVEGSSANDDPRQGQKIVIKRGVLGNYFIRVAGERSVRGFRIG